MCHSLVSQQTAWIHAYLLWGILLDSKELKGFSFLSTPLWMLLISCMQTSSWKERMNGNNVSRVLWMILNAIEEELNSSTMGISFLGKCALARHSMPSQFTYRYCPHATLTLLWSIVTFFGDPIIMVIWCLLCPIMSLSSWYQIESWPIQFHGPV